MFFSEEKGAPALREPKGFYALVRAQHVLPENENWRPHKDVKVCSA